MSYVPNENMADIARGNIPGASPFGGYGERTTTGAESNILWPGGVFTLPPPAGVQLSIASLSPDDSAAGTGVQTVDVHGLDDGLNEVTESVTLNGTSAVLTARANWRFVQCLRIRAVGSGKKAAGTISASVGAQVYAQIVAGAVRCTSSVRMVPAGKRLVVRGVYAGSVSGTAMAGTIVRLVTTYFEGHDFSADSVFVPLASAPFQDGSGSMDLGMPFVVPAGAAVGLAFTTDKATTITGTWFGNLEDV